jgi:2-polyprenyl-3-methyl-5-hydroxy-6-metoxy-1,4-benzoquinol methylase
MYPIGMNWNYQDLIDLEINGLKRLGWFDFPATDSGLRIAKRVSESDISYPSESYDPDLGNSESSGIWATHRANLISEVMKLCGAKVMWEVGSGDGNVAISLKDRNLAVIGIEPLAAGANVTTAAGIRTYLGTLEALCLPANSIDLIGAFDVVEHIEYPEGLLNEIHRVLKPNGTLILSAPAHQFLYSDFDKSIGHFRRYSRSKLQNVLEDVGFRENKLEYIFSIFVVPAILLRVVPTLFGRNRDSKATIQSDKRMNKILSIFTPLIRVLLRCERYVNLPFGLSLMSVSKK